MTRRRVTVAAASFLFLAGCAGLGPPRSSEAPASTGADVRVQIPNEGDVTHRFTVAGVPDGESGGVRVAYANGTNRTFPAVRSLDDLPHRATGDAVSLVTLAENAAARTYRLAPGSGVGTTFEGVRRNATVVDVVSRPGGGVSPRRRPHHEAFTPVGETDADATTRPPLRADRRRTRRLSRRNRHRNGPRERRTAERLRDART